VYTKHCHLITVNSVKLYLFVFYFICHVLIGSYLLDTDGRCSGVLRNCGGQVYEDHGGLFLKPAKHTFTASAHRCFATLLPLLVVGRSVMHTELLISDEQVCRAVAPLRGWL